MDIRGIAKFTLVDYPGKLACVIFTGRCNLRCPYCHNPFLVVDPESQPIISEKDFFEFLEKRKNKLDAVVISGGEPTLQNDLVGFAVKIKDMGFLVKLDTNGTNYNAVKKMLDNNCVNFIGLDYKAPIDKYYIASGRKNSSHIENLKSTIKLIVESKIPHEIRTTVHKSILSKKDLLTMREELDKFGVKQWSLQQFNPVEVIDEELLTESTYSDSELRNITKEMNNVEVKGVKYV